MRSSLQVVLFLGITILAPQVLEAQATMLGRIGGRVMEDGRPVRRMVEVRLESSTSGLLDTAYTMGSEEFEFRAVPVNRSDRLFFVIDDPGFEVVREEITLGRDPFGLGIVADVGLVTLYLRSQPEHVDETRSGTVDIRQLAAEISREARDLYGEALDLLDAGDRAAALAALERSVALAPDYFEALSVLGAEYLRLNRYGEAAITLNRALNINSNDPVVLTNLGSLHFQLGQLAEQRADDENAAVTIGDTYRQAVDYLRAATQMDPRSARIAYYLGSALYKTGDLDEAEETLWIALDLDPRMSEARLTLINVYVRQERPEAALEQIAAYLAANPDSADRENLEQARATLEQTVGN